MSIDIGTAEERHDRDDHPSSVVTGGDTSSPGLFGGGMAEVVHVWSRPADAPDEPPAAPPAEPEAEEPEAEEPEAEEPAARAADVEAEEATEAEPEAEEPAAIDPLSTASSDEALGDDSSDPGALRPSAPRPVVLSDDDEPHRVRATLALVGLILAAAVGAALVVGLAVAAVALGLRQLAG